nr:hypothetical protein 15 [Paracoccaceae bacterium]
MQRIAYSLGNLSSFNTPCGLRVGFHVKRYFSTCCAISVHAAGLEITKAHEGIGHILWRLVIYTGANKRRDIAISNERSTNAFL